MAPHQIMAMETIHISQFILKYFVQVHLGMKENFCKEHEINQSNQMASDRVLGKVKLEFNSLISRCNSAQGFHSRCT